MDTYAYDLVKTLSFLRFGGTEEECRAADILCREIRAVGGDAVCEPFQIPGYTTEVCSVRVSAPCPREISVAPWGLSGSFPAGGADLDFLYAEDGSEGALYGITDLSHAAVMVDEMSTEVYRRLWERGAAAIFVITGKWYDTDRTTDLLCRHMREVYLNIGKIPTFFVRACDALYMVKNATKSVHIDLVQTEFTTQSRNVCATIPGRDVPEESLIITAHYDSVSTGTGAWDNATGTATAMYVYRHFAQHPPRRTLRFVFCGSEEQGLLGSKAYTDMHPDLLEKEIQVGFNFDMCGTALGSRKVCVTGGDEVKQYVEAFCREQGISATVYTDVRSSDSASIADRGIPTLDLIRTTKTAEIHTRRDLTEVLSAEQLAKDGAFAVALIERVANSHRLPIQRHMPDAMKEKLDVYFQRKPAN